MMNLLVDEHHRHDAANARQTRAYRRPLYRTHLGLKEMYCLTDAIILLAATALVHVRDSILKWCGD